MLAKWHITITDLEGNVIPNATVYVVSEASGGMPMLYADRAGTMPLGNPTSADATGFCSFHAVGGAYAITARKGGFERTWRYVGIGTSQEYDVGALGSAAGWDSIVDTVADLPSGPTVGERVLVLDADEGRAGVYEWFGTGWQGPIFITGAEGFPGPVNTLEIGTVEEGPAAASITGQSPNQVLNLTIPRGDTGDITPELEQLRQDTLEARDRAEDAAQDVEGVAVVVANLPEILAAPAAASAAADSAGSAAIDADRAELAANNSAVNADVYADVAAGLAGTTSGQQFQVAVAGRYVRYRNDGGTAVSVGDFPSAHEVDAALLRELPSVGSSAQPASGVNQAGTNTYIFADPVLHDGVVREVEWYGGVSATVKVKVFRPLVKGVVIGSSGQLDLVSEEALSVVAGLNVIPTNISVLQGDFLAFYSGVTQTPHRMTSTLSPGFISAPGDATQVLSPTLTGGSTGFQNQVRFKIFTDKIAEIASKTNNALFSEQLIGNEPDPVTPGTSANVNTRVFQQPVREKGTIRKVRWYSTGLNAPISIRTFRSDEHPGEYIIPVSGDAYSQVGDGAVIYPKAAGLNEIEVNLPVETGDLIGLYGSGYTSVSDGNGATYHTFSNDTPSFTWGTQPVNATLMVEFEVELAAAEGNEPRLEALEAISPFYAPSLANLPEHTAGRIGVLADAGLVWSDGSKWHRSPAGQDLLLNCRAAVTVKIDTGEIVYSFNPDLKIGPASTAKIMNAVVALRWLSPGEMQDTITITTDDFFTVGSQSGLQVGDVVTWEDIITAMMIRSDNMGADAIGIRVGERILASEGSSGDGRTRFVAEMNNVAAELDMTDTTYTSPWGGGLEVPAIDQARLMIHANDDPYLVGIMGTPTYVINVTGPNARNVTINHNALNTLMPFPEYVASKGGSGYGTQSNNVVIWQDPDGARYVSVALDYATSADGAFNIRQLIDQALSATGTFPTI